MQWKSNKSKANCDFGWNSNQNNSKFLLIIKDNKATKMSSEFPKWILKTHGSAQKLDNIIMIYDIKIVKSWNWRILHYVPECKWTLSSQSFPYYRGGKKVRVTKLRGQLESKDKNICFLCVVPLYNCTVMRRNLNLLQSYSFWNLSFWGAPYGVRLVRRGLALILIFFEDLNLRNANVIPRFSTIPG